MKVSKIFWILWINVGCAIGIWMISLYVMAFFISLQHAGLDVLLQMKALARILGGLAILLLAFVPVIEGQRARAIYGIYSIMLGLLLGFGACFMLLSSDYTYITIGFCMLGAISSITLGSIRWLDS